MPERSTVLWNCRACSALLPLLASQHSASTLDVPLEDAAVAAVVHSTGGNFRLLHRLLTRMGRILQINSLSRVTRPVVEAARESLVIGQT